MSIQSGINQILSTGAFLASMSPGLKERKAIIEEGKKLEASQKQAWRGLEDIEKNLANPEKEYSETELKDIKSRIAEHNKTIYDVKSAALNPKYEKQISKDYVRQPEIKEKLSSIEKHLRTREEVLSDLSKRGTDKYDQKEAFSSHLENIKKDYPGLYAIYGDRAATYTKEE